MHLFVAALSDAAHRPGPTPASGADAHVGTMAWLLPVLCGLLLTAIACYKHRGLPGGH